MPVDPTVLSAIDTAAARNANAVGSAFEQHALVIAAAFQNDSRLMNGFLAGTLFNQELVEAKSAFHTPVEPQAAPTPAASPAAGK